MNLKLSSIALALAFAFGTAAQAQTTGTTRDADKPRTDQSAPRKVKNASTRLTVPLQAATAVSSGTGFSRQP